MNCGRDIAAFFAPVNKKVTETYLGIERAEELEDTSTKGADTCTL